MSPEEQNLVLGAMRMECSCLEVFSKSCPGCLRKAEATTVVEREASQVELDAKAHAELAERLDRLEVEYDSRGHKIAELEGKLAVSVPAGDARSKTIREWQSLVFEAAKERGWHSDPDGKEVNHREPERMAARIALIHAELSEALECVRGGDFDMWTNGSAGRANCDEFGGVDKLLALAAEGCKPEGLAIELADAAMRLLDFCESLGIDLEVAMRIKHVFNATRQFRHGGKRV